MRKNGEPMIVEGQTYGGAAQGIGTALFEESPYTTTANHRIDPARLHPTRRPIAQIHIEHRRPLSPYSARHQGVGSGDRSSGRHLQRNNDALSP
jgi:carbon-monoxide dehydrogenase large subunit